MPPGDEVVAPASPNHVADARLELSVAQMENRLRDLIQALIQPTMSKVSLHADELVRLRAMASDFSGQISAMYSVQTKLAETLAVLDGMRDDMGRMDAKVHQSLTLGVEDNRRIMLELELVKKGLEQKESAILHMQRSLDRAASEVNRVHDKFDEYSVSAFEKLIEESRLNSNRQIAELEAKLLCVQMDQAKLTDQLWGDETGLAKVSGEVLKISMLMETLRNSVEDLQRTVVLPADLARLSDECAQATGKAEADMQKLRGDVGKVINDTKEHLRTGIEAVSRNSGQFINDIRNAHSKEIKLSETLRDETAAFMAETREHMAALSGRVDEATTRTEALLAENVELIEQYDRRRKRDRATADHEQNSANKRLTVAADGLERLHGSVDHLRSIVGILIESSKMMCALELQDSLDRENVSLLGYREEATKVDMSSSPPSPPIASPGRTLKRSPRKVVGKPIMSVDQRCLSCSNQATTVLTAFKMACLQYNPSLVKYEQQQYARADLLQSVNDVMQRAKESWASGPEASKKTTLSTFESQVSAGMVGTPSTARPDKPLQLPFLRGAKPISEDLV
eukprot:TRINITY_DN43316_c0_g1_i1.p1 TRINITY_DN43316_c0_g1~~TRINITY_DN43316_c0_g1_i1.p1  ORF type:complete len:570 (+),score=105.33 TRINITY_DN43316_c0_g1_i1:62-1771(+)